MGASKTILILLSVCCLFFGSSALSNEFVLKDTTISEFKEFLGNWDSFKSSLAEFGEKKKEYLGECDFDSFSINDIYGFYKINKAISKNLFWKFEEELDLILRDKADAYSLSARDPCKVKGSEIRTWFFLKIGGSEYRVFNYSIFVEN